MCQQLTCHAQSTWSIASELPGEGLPSAPSQGWCRRSPLAAVLPYSLTNETGHPRLFSVTGTIRRSGVPPATFSTSLVRIASLNLSRSLIATTNEFGLDGCG